MRKNVRVVLFYLQTILIFLVVGAVTTAITKNIHSSILVEQFKSKGVLNQEKSTNYIKVYEIESDEKIPTITYFNEEIAPGGPGDILISLKSEIPVPFVKNIVSFFAGGHASLVVDTYEDDNLYGDSSMVVETTGLEQGKNLAVVSSKSYWLDSYLYKEMIGLRVDMTNLERKKVISKGISMVGDPYNYGFIFDTKNKSYCSDYIMKAYSSIAFISSSVRFKNTASKS